MNFTSLLVSYPYKGEKGEMIPMILFLLMTPLVSKLEFFTGFDTKCYPWPIKTYTNRKEYLFKFLSYKDLDQSGKLEQTLQVTKAELDASGKTIKLTIPSIQPIWGMEITHRVKDSRGIEPEGLVQNTMHQLGSKTPWLEVNGVKFLQA